MSEYSSKYHLKSSVLLQAIFKMVIDGIIVINTHGIVEAFNPAAARLFDYEPEEVLGRNINMLMPAPYHHQHDQYLDSYLKTGVKKIIGIGREVRGKRKDGSEFPFLLSVSEVQLNNRKVFAGIIHDISDIKNKEQELTQLNAELEHRVGERTEELSRVVNKLLETNKKLGIEIREREKVEAALREREVEIRNALAKEKELSELKSRFVSMASHEFRTPLSTILSSAALTGRYTTGEQQEKRMKHVNRIKSAVNNLTTILNDFLSLSKLEEGKIDNNPESFDLSVFCYEILTELKGLLKQGQQILLDTQPEKLMVTLDKRLVRNSLNNLLSNAIKYSEEDKTIYLSIETRDSQLIIKVRDEGIGIPKEDQQYLFTRFFRATNATNVQGTGLGLNIVKRYVDLMGGKIDFNSQENKGSIFTLVIPLNPKG